MTFWDDQRGAVAVLVAVGIVALLGMVALSVDVGSMYGTRADLVNAADASALAGAQKLTPSPDLTGAQSTAEAYVAANAGPGADSTVSFSAGNTEITVGITKTINLYFAPVLSSDYETADIQAEATAKVGAANGVPSDWVIPVAVLDDFYYGNHEDPEIIMDNESETPGNWGPADLDGEHGGGTSDYNPWLEFGYPDAIECDPIFTETGFPASTNECLANRLERSGTFDTCTYDEIAPDFVHEDGTICPRLVVVPIIDEWPSAQSDPTNIVGFAPFFIENTEDDLYKDNGHHDNQNPMVKGRFADYSISGGSVGNGPNFGLTAIALIK